MSARPWNDFTCCECQRDRLSAGRSPAEMGVAGRVTIRGDLRSGRGSEEELSRASSAIESRCEGGLLTDSTGVRAVEPEDAGRDGDCLDGLSEASVGVLGSGALVKRAASLPRLDDLVVAELTVRALAGFGVWSAATTSPDWDGDWDGFRACATARGPAQWGRTGRPTLARTKLARTVTGRMFSVIFSCLAESGRPKTTCWTLLYTLRQVLNASVCGFGERSCRYVWNSQKV